jgi:hypothetical protein
MAMGRVRIGYGKYPPTIIPAGVTHTRPRLYPRVGFCTRARTHRVSGGYRIPAGIIKQNSKCLLESSVLDMNLDCWAAKNKNNKDNEGTLLGLEGR